MLDLLLETSSRRKASVLCIGAHCDDIEIGCAATLRWLQRARPNVSIDWVVLSATPERRPETEMAMRMMVRPACRGRLQCEALPDGAFPAVYGRGKQIFEALKHRVRPDVIFCHERDDRHQDHRFVNEMVWGTFRDHLVLEYEVPKWDGGLGQPNVYVPFTRREATAKADALMKAYPTQTGRHWFTRETFMSMMRLRGVECRAPGGYAESFYGRKIRLSAS